MSRDELRAKTERALRALQQRQDHRRYGTAWTDSGYARIDPDEIIDLLRGWLAHERVGTFAHPGEDMFRRALTNASRRGPTTKDALEAIPGVTEAPSDAFRPSFEGPILIARRRKSRR